MSGARLPTREVDSRGKRGDSDSVMTDSARKNRRDACVLIQQRQALLWESSAIKSTSNSSCGGKRKLTSKRRCSRLRKRGKQEVLLKTIGQRRKYRLDEWLVNDLLEKGKARFAHDPDLRTSRGKLRANWWRGNIPLVDLRKREFRSGQGGGEWEFVNSRTAVEGKGSDEPEPWRE